VLAQPVLWQWFTLHFLMTFAGIRSKQRPEGFLQKPEASQSNLRDDSRQCHQERELAQIQTDNVR
jgi:hypothetical protein